MRYIIIIDQELALLLTLIGRTRVWIWLLGLGFPACEMGLAASVCLPLVGPVTKG